MNLSLIIKNGTIVTSRKKYQADIGIKNGKISFIGKLNENTKAENILDARFLYVLPGIIDSHVHFREPGLIHKEDFKTGSLAAAMGGITFFADMPNTLPPTSTYELFNEKTRIAHEKSYIDFGLFALLNNENTCEIPKLAEAGVVGFKAFLGTSTGNLSAPGEEKLAEQLRICGKFGKRTGFHAETSEINERCTAEFMRKNNTPDGILLCEARPIKSEILAVKKALDLARKTNAAIHIHHVTSKPCIEIIARAKKEGVNVTAETCPHYLFFNAENSSHKVYPPIRGEEHRIAIWDALKSGVIDMVATDHAPHTEQEKALPLWEAPAGLTGTETFVNLMLNEVNKGSLALNDFVRLASEMPAKVWGLEKKGRIEVGADADFTIIDLNKKVKIEAGKLHSKCKTTPYDNWELLGSPAATIVSGKIIVKDQLIY